MSQLSFTTISYENQEQQVSWSGLTVAQCNEFDTFMSDDVSSRLRDDDGGAEFEAHLRGLASTGFARDSLDAILTAGVSEERDWAVGEAMAEAFLMHEHGITWPWNMERDKRNPSASLPGADLVGFKGEGDDVRLALGEVKTSKDQSAPPGVMSGRTGMTQQIDRLAKNLGLVCQLLKWLLPRCKNTKYESSFNIAVGTFLNSGNKAVSLFGILIRDTEPNELDLQARGRYLASALQVPATCNLIALYLPCAIETLPSRISGGRL